MRVACKQVVLFIYGETVKRQVMYDGEDYDWLVSGRSVVEEQIG
jgi:hypothetical protein